MISLSEFEKLLREHGFEIDEDFNLKGFRDFLYLLAELQIENDKFINNQSNDENGP